MNHCAHAPYPDSGAAFAPEKGRISYSGSRPGYRAPDGRARGVSPALGRALASRAATRSWVRIARVTLDTIPRSAGVRSTRRSIVVANPQVHACIQWQADALPIATLCTRSTIVS